MTIHHSFVPEVSVPEIVYHYTSAAALLAITEEGRLHAGSTRGLNDRMELYPGREALRKRAERAVPGSVASSVWEAVKDPGVSNSDDVQSVYVLSASSNADDAAQWINYADDGRGYAIGIRRDQGLAIESDSPKHEGDSLKTALASLEAGFDSVLSPWVPVLYEEEDVEAALNELFEWAEERLSRRDDLFAQSQGVSSQEESAELFFEVQLVDFEIAAAAHSVIRRVKSAPWKTEQEYRRVAVLYSGKPLMRFKPASAGITSYVNLVGRAPSNSADVQHVDRRSGGRELPQLPIAEVICGPRAGDDHDRELVKMLLTQRGLSDVDVRSSEVLLR